MMVLISHLMVSIEWVSYPQKEYGYCRMTHIYIYIITYYLVGSRPKKGIRLGTDKIFGSATRYGKS
jgi:hypothetical protein